MQSDAVQPHPVESKPDGSPAVTPPPARPRDDSPAALGFTRKPMVDWLSPIQLMNTGVKVLLSTVFGAYADRRELMAVAAAPDESDYSDREELWLDYTADLGDGFDSGYAIARLLGAPGLQVHDGEQPLELPRGHLLVLGGDEVYPVATREEYADRLVGPYRAALPWVHVEEERPHLFAIPGNHDWYDGLTSFNRLFCQRRSIGGWLTRQSRSYFAVKLPHGWWLWGLDVQLESDVDYPQIQYFERVARERMQPGERVILCTPEPSWVYDALGSHAANRNLEFIRRSLIEAHGGTVPLMLAGDLHHYARYQSADGRCQKITSGGGGAFLHGTHDLPETLPGSDGCPPFQRAREYPPAKTSAGLLWRNLLFPLLDWRFCLLLGGVYLLFAWFLESASMSLDNRYFADTFALQLIGIPLGAEGLPRVLADFLRVLGQSPGNVVFLAAILLGMVGFVEAPPGRSGSRWAVGLAHGAAHVLLILVLFWSFAHLNQRGFALDLESPAEGWLFALEMFLAGGLLGGLLTGGYLLVTNRWLGLNRTPALSSLRVADFKHFLRLHITPEGVTLYPLALDRVPRRWQVQPKGDPADPWLDPMDRPLAPRLIERPIHIPAATPNKEANHGRV